MVTAKEAIKLLEANGWQLDSVKGSHHQFKHPERKGKITIALHKGDIPPGTLNSILKQAGLK
jgi:predicted RNA binding protein YcfA (HicA-like mRNA interferase family)